MIRDSKVWSRWGRSWQRKTPADPEVHFRILQELLKMAKALGGLDIKLAKMVNTYVKKPAG